MKMKLGLPVTTAIAPRCAAALILALLGAGLASVGRGQAITEFAILSANARPVEITAGPDGNLWFTDEFGNKIGRITTAGVITEFPTPSAVSEPHGIAAGPDGNLWFTELAGRKIGRITPAGAVTEFPISTASGELVGITAGPDGNLWVTGFGGGKIERITPAGAVTEFPISTAASAPYGIAAGPDGNLWFTELGGKIGRITPAGAVTEFPISTAISQPVGIAAGPDGNLWFTEAGANNIGRITTGGVITEFSIPTASSEPVGIAAGPDGALWFTENNGKIGRITTGPCGVSPTTLCLGNGRFLVTATWQSPTASGQGTAVPLTADTGYFWFFSASNVEMIVKVLDACSLNAHKWVFAGGLTNVEVTLTVTDTQTGGVKTYLNPANTAFLPIQDTAAFGTCP